MPEEGAGGAGRRLFTVGDVAIFVDELRRGPYPEIVGFSAGASGCVRIAYGDSLPEEKEEEIRQSILKRYPQLTVRFVEEKIHKQELRKMFGPSAGE